MKEVKRFKCDFCSKVTARAKTMEKHEKQCWKNPNCVNCYMCEHSYIDEYDYDDGYHTAKDVPQCAYYEEPLPVQFATGCGNIADKCSFYKRSNQLYYDRDYEMAHSNLIKNGGADE